MNRIALTISSLACGGAELSAGVCASGGALSTGCNAARLTLRVRAGYGDEMPNHAIEDTSVDGHATKTLKARDARLEATFAPAVGMIACSLTHRGEELLGQRGGLKRYAETGSTMGIPLLHPWANRLSGLGYEAAGSTVELDPKSAVVRCDANGLPIHGLLAASRHWRLGEVEATEEHARLRAALDFAAFPELLAAFPFPHQLELEVLLREDVLAIATTLSATGEVPVPVSFGFHPYFRLPGLPRDEWSVRFPVRRELIVDERMIPTGETKSVPIVRGPLGDWTFDTPYGDLEQPAHFLLEGGGRRIDVHFAEGYPWAQVFAPSGADFICFEPMTAPTNALVSGRDLPLVQPGESFTATFAIRVEATS